MSAILAIVQDTWRQSKQQMVFIVMLLLLFVLSLALILIPKVYPETVTVLQGSGAGAFTPGSQLSFEATQAIALSDIDGDGDLDAICGSGPGEADRLWLNDGQGHFSAGATLGESAGDTRVVAVGDVDRDGDPDVITGGVGADTVYLNDGKGSFSAGARLSDAASAALALGDLDGDGDLDVVVGHAQGATTWIGDGKGGFSKGVDLGAGDVRGLALAKLRETGALDLLVVRAEEGGNQIYTNDGTGTYTAGQLLGKSNARAAVAADLNLDGRPDLVVGNFDGQRVQVWLNTGLGAFVPAAIGGQFGYSNEGGLLTLAIADLDGDQKPDLVSGAAAGGENTAHLNRSTKPKAGDAGTQPRFERQAPLTGSELRSLAVGDVDGDGKVDVLGVFPQRDLGFIWSDEPSGVLSQVWVAFYSQTLMKQEGKQGKADRQGQFDAAVKSARKAQEIPAFQRAIEAWLVIGAKAIFSLSMILFIVACSAYYPSLLAEGAVDVVLSRPVSRLRIFLARFAGGLALFSAAILATYALVFVGIGVRTGVWHGRLFLAAPLHIYAATVIYAILGCIGVLFRSTTLAVILGLFFYLAVDTGVEIFVMMQNTGAFEDGSWPSRIADGLQLTLPNFGLLKNVANMSVLNVPSFDAQPIAVAGVWMLVCLGLGYWKFRTTDY